MLIDTHCHLHYDYAPKSTQDLIQEAESAGVKQFITIGVELGVQDQIQAISEKYPQVFHTVGVHPHDVQAVSENYLDQIANYARHSKCVAIGEIGLDYYYEHSPREIQIQRFKEQLNVAKDSNLPVVIHARDADSDLIPCLQDFAKGNQLPGIIHCFTGTEHLAQVSLSLGFMISFSGILTFKKSDDLRKIAAQVPLNQLLIETDCPYLAPVPHRGKKCEPSMVVETAKVLAAIHGLSLEELGRITTANTYRLFPSMAQSGL